MMMEPPWRGAQSEIRESKTAEELVRRAVAYGLELARGECAEVESKVAREDYKAPGPPTEIMLRRWAAVHEVDMRCAHLVQRIEDDYPL